MLIYLWDNHLYVMAAALFFLLLLYLIFAFRDYIPHFLVAVYFLLPLFYQLAHLQDLPLTTVFVLLLGPAIVFRAPAAVFTRFLPVAVYLFLVIATSTVNQVSMFEHRSAFVPLLIAFLSAVSLSSGDVEKRIKFFSYLIVAWIVLNALFSVLQLGLGNDFYLISATAGNPEVLGVKRGYGLIGMATQVGVTFCLGVPLIGALLLDPNRKKVLLGLLFIVGYFGLVSAFSRGAIFGVFLALFFLLLSHRRYKLLAFWALLFVTIIASYSTLMAMLPGNYSFFLQAKDGSAGARMPYTMVAMKMLADRPLTGFGFGGFSEKCTEYGLKMHIESHNTYTQVLVEYGIIGFIPFLLLIAGAIRGYLAYLRSGASRELKVHVTGYLSALVAILVDATVHCFEWNLVFWIPVMFGFLMAYLKDREASTAEDTPVAGLGALSAGEGAPNGG